jgi:hypothetical protein
VTMDDPGAGKGKNNYGRCDWTGSRRNLIKAALTLESPVRRATTVRRGWVGEAKADPQRGSCCTAGKFDVSLSGLYQSNP